MMVRVGASSGTTAGDGDGTSRPPESSTDEAVEAASLVGEWNVTEVDGAAVLDGAPASLVFGADGSLGGTGGCNSFSSTYSTAGDALTVESEVAMTLVACDAATTAQESAVLAFLTDGTRFEIGEDGTLTLESSDGTVLIAER